MEYLADCDVRPVHVEEDAPHGLRPEEAIEVIARKKAIAGSRRDPEALVLGVDTALSFRGRMLGKPADADEARLTLAMLSDARHTVITGLALAHDGRRVDDSIVATKVRFDRIPVEAFDSYLDSKAWMGKAGGYGIQDPLLAPFIHIDGPWSNVVGLPLAETARMLRDNGVDVNDPPEESWLRDHNPFDRPSE